MMKESRERHSNLHIYLLYLVVITFVITSVSLSRYTKIVELRDEAKAARVVVKYVPISATLSGVPITDLSEGLSFTDMEPGDEVVYTFEIRNYDGELQNQVKMKYLIDVTFDPAPPVLPLTFNLVPAASYPSAGSSWTALSYGPGNIAHSYTLTINWDEDAVAPGYIGQAQTVKIDISSEQMDN